MSYKNSISRLSGTQYATKVPSRQAKPLAALPIERDSFSQGCRDAGTLDIEQYVTELRAQSAFPPLSLNQGFQEVVSQAWPSDGPPFPRAEMALPGASAHSQQPPSLDLMPFDPPSGFAAAQYLDSLQSPPSTQPTASQTHDHILLNPADYLAALATPPSVNATVTAPPLVHPQAPAKAIGSNTPAAKPARKPQRPTIREGWRRIKQGIQNVLPQKNDKATKPVKAVAPQSTQQPNVLAQLKKNAGIALQCGDVEQLVEAMKLCPLNERATLIEAAWESTKQQDQAFFIASVPLLVRAALVIGDESVRHFLATQAMRFLRAQQAHHRTHGTGPKVFSSPDDDDLNFLASLAVILIPTDIAAQGTSPSNWLKGFFPASHAAEFDSALEAFKG